MPGGRNDPCPCGSGRKYKRCCWSKDESARRLRLVPGTGGRRKDGGGGPPATPPTDVDWEVDLVPVPVTLDDDPDARPAALLIVADGLVIHHDILAHPPAEPQAVAELLAEAVRDTAKQTNRLPRRVLVGHPAVAEALSHRAAPGGAPIECDPLPQLDDAANALIAHLSGAPDGRPSRASLPQTWRAWGLEHEVIGDVFSAAATYYRAKPWRYLENVDLFAVECPSGTMWVACVLGAAGEEFGIALYEDPLDFERLISSTPPNDGFRSLQGTVLSLSFDRRNDLPPRMRKEILAAGWELAAPDAYPLLMAFNTPGGGVTEAQARDLAATLRAMAEFTGRFGAELRSGIAPAEWHDPSSGVTLARVRAAERSVLWQLPDTLAQALPAGSGALAEAALEVHDPEHLRSRHEPLLEAFERALTSAGLSAVTVGRHAGNAALLVDYLTDYEGIPLHAMTEYDLREFLYDWCVRKVIAPKADMRAIPISLKRFFAFVAERERVSFPWAQGILADRQAFEARLETFPGGFFWEKEVRDWMSELTLDLAARQMLPDDAMANGGEWGETMGSVEWELHRELRRRWLLWRDEVIASGLAEPVDVRKELVQR
ncbi:MAG: SEC-C metal-binding domain-containing protein [Gemmatimonadales bacterium]